MGLAVNSPVKETILTPENTKVGRQPVIQASPSDLEQCDEDKGDKKGDQGGRIDRYDLISFWVCELGIYQRPIQVVDGE